MVIPRGRRQHWSNLLKAFSMKGGWACLSPHFLSISQSWIVQIKSNQLQVSSEEWEENRGGEKGRRGCVWTRTRCDQDNSVSVIVAQTAPTRAERVAIPPVSMPANNEEAPEGRGGRRGGDTRDPQFWLHPLGIIWTKRNQDSLIRSGDVTSPKAIDVSAVRCRSLSGSRRNFPRIRFQRIARNIRPDDSRAILFFFFI